MDRRRVLSLYDRELRGEIEFDGLTKHRLHNESGRGDILRFNRKHGYYSAVLAARVREANKRNNRYLMVEAGPMSQPIVARHGFQLLTFVHTGAWNAG